MLHGLFHDELCLFKVKSLFDPTNPILIHHKCEEIINILYGGIRTNQDSNPKKAAYQGWIVRDEDKNLSNKELWNNARISYLRSFGYDGPINYDESGMVVSMTPQEIDAYIKEHNSVSKSKPTEAY